LPGLELVCGIVAGSAVLLELVQVLTPDRHGEIHDAIEKIAGAAAGVFTGVMIRWFNKFLRRFQNQP
jgi:VanZ family protein